MGRTRKSLERGEPFRDSTLVLVATEGAQTEKRYFDRLTSRKVFGTSRLRVDVVSNSEGQSDPRHVLENLKRLTKRYQLGEGDVAYLVIDRDHWTQSHLAEVASECEKCGFQLIVSNPCFELWFLLHRVDVSSLSAANRRSLLENKRVSNERNYVDRWIVKEFGSYQKSSPYNPEFLDLVYIKDALTNAEKLDQFPDHRWPEYLCTRVYRIVCLLLRTFFDGQ